MKLKLKPMLNYMDVFRLMKQKKKKLGPMIKKNYKAPRQD